MDGVGEVAGEKPMSRWWDRATVGKDGSWAGQQRDWGTMAAGLRGSRTRTAERRMLVSRQGCDLVVKAHSL